MANQGRREKSDILNKYNRRSKFLCCSSYFFLPNFQMINSKFSFYRCFLIIPDCERTFILLTALNPHFYNLLLIKYLIRFTSMIVQSFYHHLKVVTKKNCFSFIFKHNVKPISISWKKEREAMHLVHSWTKPTQDKKRKKFRHKI